MNLLIIKKKNIIYFSLITLTLLGVLIAFKFTQPSPDISTFNPIDNDSDTLIDLTGDGLNDSIKLLSHNNNIDVQINSNNKIYLLSTLCENNILLSEHNYWPAKIYIKNISKSKIPQIIVQGAKDNTSIQYVFSWNNGHFVKLFSSNKNIFGVLDSSNSRTPQCYSLTSSLGVQSLKSFMLIDNELVDITKDCKSIPNLSEIISLIDIIQKNYEIEEVPDIFKQDIPSQEFGLLWNLDKEHNTYSFQDAFFYDDSIDDEGNITSMKWRLTFEKYINQKDDNSKSEFVLYVTSERISNNDYKISSLYTK